MPEISVLFVDDSSPDGTSEEIRRIALAEPWVRLLVRSSKQGLGSAYQTGFSNALSAMEFDVVVEMDADLQHPPGTIPALVQAIESGADVAIGSRYVAGGSVVGWNMVRKAVSRGANSFARALLGLNVRDATSGFRAYNAKSVKLVAEAKLPAAGFEFQVASLFLLKEQAKMVEVPFTFVPRAAGTSKLGFGDILQFFFAVVRMSVS